MTLILAVANPGRLVLATDRRLSRAGVPVDDESNKVAYMVCSDASLGVAFTGIAQLGARGPKTEHWILETILEASKADNSAHATITRFAAFATDRFARLRGVKEVDKALTVVFLGYSTLIPPVLWQVSNFEEVDRAGPVKAGFSIMRLPPNIDKPAFVFVAGIDEALPESERKALIGMAKRGGVSAQALVNRSVGAIRAAAESPKSKRAVGKQITTLAMRRTPNSLSVDAAYHSAHTASTVYLPNLVDTVRGTLIADPAVEMTGIVNVPPVGRNERCPCGSGRKYKKCHGGPGAPLIVTIGQP